ncbi:transcriptional regulator [Paenibacillus dendritiformis]|nr:GntR family transcriptional regulator [Paenibacillus dendritiformis]MBG9791094.1 transcriptional regulator [Paenibacillus dendritiformis]
MSANHSKSALLYERVRHALQSGHYIPGQRISPRALAMEFGASLTPTRLALHRLVGAGLLEHHARGGMLVPLPSEAAMRDHYHWMESLLLLACDIGASPFPLKPAGSLKAPSPGDDLDTLTWQLFDTIAAATAHSLLHRAVRQSNDQLAPIRRAKQHLLDHRLEELSELIRYWHAQDYAALKSGLHDYHERRRQLVPCIVATLIERRNSLH